MSNQTDILQIKLETDGDGKVKASLAGVEQQIDGVGKSTDRFSGQLTGARIGIAALGAGAVVAARDVFQLAEEYKGITARLTNATNGQDDFNASLDATKAIALATGQPLEGIAGLYGKLRLNAGLLADDAERLTGILAKATQLDGGGEGANAALFQLQQGLASGTLRGEELNSVLEQTPTLALAIARGLDMPIGKLRDFASEGELTAEVVKKALFDQQAVIEEQFARLPLKAEMAFENVRTAAMEKFGNLDQELGITTGFAEAINGIANNLDTVLDITGLVVAMVGGRLTAAISTSTVALTKKALADQAVAQASLASAAAEKSAADAELRRTTALVAEAKAERDAATAVNLRGAALTNINVRVAQATAEQTAATARLAAAQNSYSVAATRASVASRAAAAGMTAMRGVMGILGGPAGLLMTAAAGITYWVTSSNDATGSTDDWRESIDNLTGSMDKLRAKQLTAEIDAMTTRIAEQEQVVLRLHKTLKTDPYASVEGTSINKQVVEELHAQQDELDAMREGADKLAESLAKVKKGQEDDTGGTGGDSAGDIEDRQKAMDSYVKSLLKAELNTDLFFEKQQKLDDLFVTGRISQEAYTDALERLNAEALSQTESEKARKELMDEGLAVYQKTRTEMELMADEQARLDYLFSQGAIDLDTYSRAMFDATEKTEGLKESGEDAFQKLESAIRGWGDAFTNTMTDMVMSGKADFSDLADSIIRDLVRIAIQKSITDQIIGGAAGVDWSGMFSSFIHHSGGLVGESSASRQVSAAAFIGAPRYHSGGIVGDEVPAILRRGEEVLTATDPRHRNNLNGDGMKLRVELVNQSGAPLQATDGGQRFDGDGMVQKIILKDIGRGGPISSGLARTYGLQRKA